MPAIERTGGHDIGVAGEGQHRPLFTTPCPQVGDLAKLQGLAGKAEFAQSLADQLLAALVIRGDRVDG